MSNELLTPEEVATRLRVSPKSVRKWLRERKIIGTKTGRIWRVREDDLTRFLSGKPEEKAASLLGKFTDSRWTVDDFLREKHEETDREERKWEERNRCRETVTRPSALGFLSNLPGSVDEFLREKHAETEAEERRWEEGHSA